MLANYNNFDLCKVVGRVAPRAPSLPDQSGAHGVGLGVGSAPVFCDSSFVTCPHLLRLLCIALFCQSATAVFAQTNSQQIYLQCLTNFETYAENIWTTSAT